MKSSIFLSLVLAATAWAYPHAEIANHGAVASSDARCSQFGIDAMKSGGNAADAMVATVICIGAVTMYHSGIGGGGFSLVRAPNGTYEMLDFRDQAPAAAFTDMYNNDTALSLYGGLAAGIPGELRGLEAIHTSYGSLPWADLLTPTVELAREGFTIGGDLYKAMLKTFVNDDGSSYLASDPTFGIDFAPNGTLLGLGETLRLGRLSNTLETIAAEGADAFYTGSIANATIAANIAGGGIFTHADLENYAVKRRPTAEIAYRGYKIVSTSAPSSGAVGLSALNAFEEFAELEEDTVENRALKLHRLIESTKFAYGMRGELGDPDFVDGMAEFQQDMVSDELAAEVRSLILDYTTQNTSIYDPLGLESLETPGTSHIVTSDSSGLSLTLTSTVNLYFGSRLQVPETGVILNNQMNDFSIPDSSNIFGYIPSEANYIKPNKRPLSSISPTIVEHPNGTVYFIAGSAGGSRIITATMQNIYHVLEDGMTAIEAMRAPRWHDQLSPNETSFEYAFDNFTTQLLAQEGHNITWIATGESTAQTIRVLSNGTFEAAGETRQENSGGFAW